MSMELEELYEQLEHKAKRFHEYLHEIVPHHIPKLVPAYGGEQIRKLITYARLCYGEYCHELMTNEAIDIDGIVDELTRSPIHDIADKAAILQSAVNKMTPEQLNKARLYCKFLLETTIRINDIADRHSTPEPAPITPGGGPGGWLSSLAGYFSRT